MTGLSEEAVREFLVGTWIGVALIVDALIDAGVVRRHDLVNLLAEAETVVTDNRGVALRALARLIRDDFDAKPPQPPMHPTDVLELIRRHADKRPSRAKTKS